MNVNIPVWPLLSNKVRQGNEGPTIAYKDTIGLSVLEREEEEKERREGVRGNRESKSKPRSGLTSHERYIEVHAGTYQHPIGPWMPHETAAGWGRSIDSIQRELSCGRTRAACGSVIINGRALHRPKGFEWKLTRSLGTAHQPLLLLYLPTYDVLTY